MLKITKNTAPAFTPNNPGEAIGLRVSACINKPAMASAAPVSNAMIVLEVRVPVTMWCSSFALSKLNNACINVIGDTSVFPIIKLEIATITRQKPASAI